MSKSTLFEKMTEGFYTQQRKHGKSVDYPERVINCMSNFEFLEHLSEALESVLEERANNK